MIPTPRRLTRRREPVKGRMGSPLRCEAAPSLERAAGGGRGHATAWKLAIAWGSRSGLREIDG